MESQTELLAGACVPWDSCFLSSVQDSYFPPFSRPQDEMEELRSEMLEMRDMYMEDDVYQLQELRQQLEQVRGGRRAPKCISSVSAAEERCFSTKH